MLFDGYLSIQRDVELYNKDMQRKARLLAYSLRNPIISIWQELGQKRALQLINDANAGESEITIRWIWIDNEIDSNHKPLTDSAILSDLKKGKDLFITTKLVGSAEEHLISYIPIFIPNQRKGALELTENLKGLKSYTDKTIRKIAILAFLLLFISSLFFGIVGFFNIGRRLKQLKKKAIRIGKGDLTGPVHIKGKDELTDLGNTLNNMCMSLQKLEKEKARETEARLEMSEQLHHADRLKTIGTLASGIAHELGTPLSVVIGRAGHIMSSNDSTYEIRAGAEIVKNQANRMTELIKQLLDFARHDTIQKTKVDLYAIVQQTVDFLKPMINQNRVHLELWRPKSTAWVRVDVAKFQQVIINLLNNAIQATPANGKIQISIVDERVGTDQNNSGSSGEYKLLVVRDFGTGIKTEHIPYIFNPFYTTKGSGKGTGLGLSIVHSIVREHDGWIEVESDVGKGTCFKIYLPEEGE